MKNVVENHLRETQHGHGHINNDDENKQNNNNIQPPRNNKNILVSKWKEIIFLLSVTGISALFGFGRTVTSSKKYEPKNLNQTLHYEGNRLALRALGWGTLWAMTGTGFICYSIWKLSGAHNFEEFRLSAGNLLPQITNKHKVKDDDEFKDDGGGSGGSGSRTRTNFTNLTDLIQYIINEDNNNNNNNIKKK